MKSAIKKNELTIRGTDRLLYDRLLEKISSMPGGKPMPSVQTLKNEFNVGYKKLKRVLDYMETQEFITVRNCHGIFINEKAMKLSNADSSFMPQAEHNLVPWLRTGDSEISFYVPGSHPELNMWQELVRLYNDSAPYAKIVVETKSGLDGNSDIIYFPSRLERIITNSDSLLDLSPFIRQSPPELSIYDYAWDRKSILGAETVVGVAPYLVTGFLAYQRNLFKKIGISWNATPAWEELSEAGRFLKKNIGSQKSFIFSGYMPFFFRWGISLSSDDGRRVRISPEQIAPLLFFLKKLIVEDQSAPLWSEVREKYCSQYSFLRGYAAMEAFSYFNIDSEDIGFVSPPLKNDGKELIFFPVLSISKNTPWQEECWKFIQLVLSDSGQRIIAKYKQVLPISKDISPENINSEKLEVMRHALEHGQIEPEDYVVPYQARTIIQSEIEGWLKKETDIAEMCQRIENRCLLFKKHRRGSGQ